MVPYEIYQRAVERKKKLADRAPIEEKPAGEEPQGASGGRGDETVRLRDTPRS